MLRSIGYVLTVAVAFVFELLGRVFHALGEVCLGGAIMILGALSHSDKETE